MIVSLDVFCHDQWQIDVAQHNIFCSPCFYVEGLLHLHIAMNVIFLIVTVRLLKPLP